MSAIKGLTNIHWLVTVLAAYLCHIYKFKIVGFLVDYDVNFPSTLFVLSFAMLFAEYKLWPVTLKKPCYGLLLTYEMLMSVLLTNIARTLVWMPLLVTLKDNIPVVAKKVIQFNSRLRLRKYGLLFKFARWLDSDCGLNELSKVIAIAVFIWVLYSTDTFDHMRELFGKIQQKLRCKKALTSSVCAPPRRPPVGMCTASGRRMSDVLNIAMGDMADEPNSACMSSSVDCVTSRRDNLDSDTDEPLPPPTTAVPSGS